MKVLYIIISTLLMCSCVESERETIISGQVVDKITGEPINTVCIAILGMKNYFLKGGEHVSTDMAEVDTEGQFYLTLKSKNIDDYLLRVYLKEDGNCDFNIEETEMLGYSCITHNCNSLQVGKIHHVVVEVSLQD